MDAQIFTYTVYPYIERKRLQTIQHNSPTSLSVLDCYLSSCLQLCHSGILLSDSRCFPQCQYQVLSADFLLFPLDPSIDL